MYLVPLLGLLGLLLLSDDSEEETTCPKDGLESRDSEAGQEPEETAQELALAHELALAQVVIEETEENE